MRAALPARVRGVLAPLAAAIEELPASPALAALTRYLPQPNQGWSALEELFQRQQAGERTSLSLSALLRAAKRHLHEKSQPAAPGPEKKESTEPCSSSRTARAAAPLWDDWRAMADSYVSAAGPRFSKEITAERALASPFNLRLIYSLHQKTCTCCQQRGQFETAILAPAAGGVGGNCANPCQISVILAWLAGQWRLPWTTEPPPPSGEAKPNRPSFLQCPQSLAKPTAELIEFFLRELPPGEAAAMSHPLLAVARAQDVRRALAFLRKLGRAFNIRPGRDPVTHLDAVDELNAHIQAVIKEMPATAKAAGLEPVKVRPCVDMTELNDHLPELRFYCPFEDAAALVRPGWKMARIDLYKAFNQLLVHPDDAPYMAVEVAGRRYVPLRALFGGSLFPHYISTVMAAVMEILRAEGIPAVVMMDDIFICGNPRGAHDPESCAARLSRGANLLEQMGFKLNAAKTLGPAQQLTFKGIQIDSVRGRLSIDEEKLAVRVGDLDDWLGSSTWSRKEAKALLGQLGWICSVLQAGRPHLARIRHGVQYGRPRSHQQPITADQHEAMRWFRATFEAGQRTPLWAPFWPADAASPIAARIFSDASGTEGFGLVIIPSNTAQPTRILRGQWPQASQPPPPQGQPQRSPSSSYHELIPILLAVHLLAPDAREGLLAITTDNLGNAFAINKGHSNSIESFQLLASIFEEAERYGVFLVADWVPREHNHLLDLLPRERSIEAIMARLQVTMPRV